MNLFEELELRGLVKQTTNAEKIGNLLNNEQITFYIGFDPTADSLHVGHLLQLITAKRLMRAGHTPIILTGGATATVGDPTGKTEIRKSLSLFTTISNSEKITSQMRKIMAPTMMQNCMFTTNLAWFDGMSFLTMLRELAPHFSVNNMLRADCFKSRMENGLSFLEFNYMVMQACDFWKLNEQENCVLQIGGDDQWSNILAGIDLIHKKEKKEVFGMTLPLLLNSDGTKMGKTEKGAVWLDEEKTSVFDFFQFWRNVSDTEVMKCFKMLTFLSLEEIDAIPFSTVAEINAAKKKLAHAMTEIVHGKLAADATLEMAEALFESRDSEAMDTMEIDDGIHILDLLVVAKLAKSRTDARNLINGRGVAINDQVLDNPTLLVNRLEFGGDLVVRKGKKNFRRFIFMQ